MNNLVPILLVAGAVLVFFPEIRKWLMSQAGEVGNKVSGAMQKDCVDSLRDAMRCVPKENVEGRRAIAKVITDTLMEEEDV